MLKERGYYKEELPINVVTAHIEDYPAHFHDDLEVIYVLEGSLTVKNGYYKYLLKEGEIFVLNDREIHSFEKTKDENMVMMIQINLEYFSKYYVDLKNSFFSIKGNGSPAGMEVLRSILSKIMIEVLEKGYGYEHKVIESTHNLIACLLSEFQDNFAEEKYSTEEGRGKGNRVLSGRLRRITEYMYENYNRKLTLNEIAEKEHLSIYYLSHVIKESTGLSFQDLLSFIRVDESEPLLLSTDKKICLISDEIGFSAVRYYIKHFKVWFGMHPLEYRKKYSGKDSVRYSAAKYVRCTPQEIESSVRKRSKGVYSEYIKSKKPAPIIIDLDIQRAIQSGYESNDVLEYLLDREDMKPIARPYNLMKSLKERTLYAGKNFLITTGSLSNDEVNSLSILVYNVNDFIRGDLSAANNREKLYEICSRYDEEGEFLIKCSGISGDFNVSRYRISKDNIVTAYKEGLRPPGVASKRETLINSWSTLPDVEFSEISTSDTLSIRAGMRGISAEIILIDRK